ncbi:ASCH domain-containing protein [Nakamurella alba]|uniref:ASCH domain-containing protein n=1 Tax=Nakamurella alba TaxID=2665158 RepID=UPI0018AB37A1|nr:ASCH domain-containing protein [Nakamurella alba]
MLLPKAVCEGIAEGRVTQAFRRWDKPRVKVGGTQLTPVGTVAFDAVEPADESTLTERDAELAGLKNLATLHKMLARTEGDLYRITLRLAGPDPRVALRELIPEPVEIEALTAKMDRMDKGSPTGPWTREVLRWIRDHPGIVSTEMAAALDRERWALKTDVRRLKTLGLTISLEVGYLLSPRGEAYLAATEPKKRVRRSRAVAPAAGVDGSTAPKATDGSAPVRKARARRTSTT